MRFGIVLIVSILAVSLLTIGAASVFEVFPNTSESDTVPSVVAQWVDEALWSFFAFVIDRNNHSDRTCG